jgi:hypothetical protein
MKTPTSKTTEVSAASKANSTLLSGDFQPRHGLSDTENELLLVIGDVAGRFIAAHLYQRHSAQVHATYRGKI